MAQLKQLDVAVPINKLRVCSVLLLSLLSAGLASAEIEVPDSVEPYAGFSEAALETDGHASVQSGYRFIAPEGMSAAASPYGRLTSGVTGGFSAGTLGADLKLMVDGSFLHEDDYHTELFFDYRGLIRFHAESQSLWHNLVREKVNPGTLTLLARDEDVTAGVRTAVTQTDARFKLGNNPFHLNLGYWELSRKGYGQLRYSDHYFGTAANSIITETTRVDHITREGSIGLDAHLGPLDLSYAFRIRDFLNEAPDPLHTFTPKTVGDIMGDRHNVTPDSRVTSHTLKLYSDLSGGLTGSASYNLTQRENTGGHGDSVPSERPSDVIHSIASDVTYNPSKQHSYAFKYRHREIDRTTPASLYYPYTQISAPPSGVYTAVPGELLVRPAPSSVKDTLTFSATFRPAPRVIYRLEYNAELEMRENVRDAQSLAGLPTALHSDSRQTHAGTAVFYWKPVSGGTMNASYRYATCDNPFYGTSFADQHTGKILLTYSRAGTWGISSNYLIQYESGEGNAWVIPPANLAISTGSVSSHHVLPRKTLNNSMNINVWFSPLERLTINTGYSFFKAEINQTSLLTELSRNALAATRYDATNHVYSIDANYAVSEQIDFSLTLQQVFSKALYFVPPIAEFSATDAASNTTSYSSTGISELTRLTTTETGVSARADWRITALLGCTVDYNFRRYSGNTLFDGSVHAGLVTLKARW